MDGMYSLAIVDDEPAIRRGLTRHIDWESMGFRVVESFEDGEDALAYLEHHHVDVILTDIRMSVMSGLSLARAIHERGLNTEVVILSGYKDFEYARSAMQSEVRSYLLKPTREEELRTVFAGIHARLSSGRGRGSAPGIRRLLTESRRQLLMRIIDGLVERPDELTEAWRRAVLPLTADLRIAYAQMRIVDGRRGAEQRDSRVGVLQRHVHRLCLDKLDRTTIALVEPPDLLHFLVIARSVEPDDELDAIAACREIAMSQIEGAAAALEPISASPTFSSPEHLLSLSMRHREDEVVITSARAYELSQMLLDVAPEEAARVVRDELCRSRGRLRAVRYAAIDLVSGFIATCRRRAPDRCRSGSPDYDGLFRCTTAADVAAWAAMSIIRLTNGPPGPSGGYRRRIVERARAYVCAHLGEDVSLEQIAGEVYLSPAYLSRVFREESGQTFIDFVTETRMDHAISLLTGQPDLSVAEVARLVGYADPKYFARVFKTRIGRTPSRYRRALANR